MIKIKIKTHSEIFYRVFSPETKEEWIMTRDEIIGKYKRIGDDGTRVRNAEQWVKELDSRFRDQFFLHINISGYERQVIISRYHD